MPKLSFPKNDWNCREVLDAKSVTPEGESTCEFCSTRIRWIHVLVHDHFPRSVEAGCCCAKRLCSDYDAEGAERELKNRTSRLMRFIDPRRWERSKSNPVNTWRWVKLANGRTVRLTVFLKDGTFGIYFADKKDSRDTNCHFERYESRREAMTVAFDLIERGRAVKG